MNTYYAFSDESGQYNNHPGKRFIQSHPYYVRATVLISVEEYAEYQQLVRGLDKQIGVPPLEEIKWSDLWSKKRGNPRNTFIEDLTQGTLRKYFDEYFAIADKFESIKIILTVTENGGKNIANKDTMLYFHLQEAFQRINSEIKDTGFATFIIDELSDDFADQTKRASHRLLEKGDIVKYSTLYSGILFEKSNLSAGIQMADYVAGVFNSFLKSIDAPEDSYRYAKCIFCSFIKPRLRKSKNGQIMGYGIREVTRNAGLRDKISSAL